MRKHYRVFIISILVAIATNDAEAQIMSIMETFSPSNSTLIGSASRIGFDNGAWSTYYMRYNDNSYFCGHYHYSAGINSSKITMPQDFIITDFKNFLSDPGFIGSYQMAGMYGYSPCYTSYNYYDNYLRVIKIPDVNQLKRTAIAHPLDATIIIGMKFFSIGEKTVSSKTTPQSYLLEYYMWGTDTYIYTPLAYNPQSNEQEIADDVITVGEYAVFATRDTRSGHAPVNLRISDTNNVLSGTSIDYQWRFFLQNHESLYGEIRMLSLEDNKYIIMAYTIQNTNDNEYYLCVHRIYLPDFLAGINNIVSHEIKLNRDCVNLTDMIYEPKVQTMVILLNGDGISRFYHIDPYSNTNDITTILNYPDGNFYSMDTIGGNYYSNEIKYIAMGNDVIFTQDISNGITIVQSCLDKKKTRFLIRDFPVVKYEKDPLTPYYNERINVNFEPPALYFSGTRPCIIIDEK